MIVAFGDNIHSYLSIERTTTLDHLQSIKDIPHVSYIGMIPLMKTDNLFTIFKFSH
jgi:hypothetical protein